MNFISALVFNDSISLGNLIEILAFLIGGVFAFASLRERSIFNGLLIKEVKDRLDRVDLEQIKERTDIMWVFQLRRGLVEAELKGLGKEGSPFKLTQEANELIQPLVPLLKDFYTKIGGDTLGLVELAVELEAQWGRQIADLVCKKVAVSEAACMVVAIANLRPISNEILDQEAAKIRSEKHRLKKLTDLPVQSDVRGGRWNRK